MQACFISSSNYVICKEKLLIYIWEICVNKLYQNPDVFEINIILNGVSKHIIYIYLIRK